MVNEEWRMNGVTVSLKCGIGHRSRKATKNFTWDSRNPSQGRNRHMLNIISENYHYTKLLVEVTTNISAELELVFQSMYNEWSKIATTLPSWHAQIQIHL
jgi:hypothetical protein